MAARTRPAAPARRLSLIDMVELPIVSSRFGGGRVRPGRRSRLGGMGKGWPRPPLVLRSTQPRDEGTEHRAHDGGTPAEDRGAADQHSRDRGEEIALALITEIILVLQRQHDG